MKTTIYQRLKILPVLLFGFTKIFGSSFSTHFRVSPKYPSKDKDACKNKPNNVLTAWLPRSQSWICIHQSVLCQPSPQSYGRIFGHQRPDCEIPRDNFGDGYTPPPARNWLLFLDGENWETFWKMIGLCQKLAIFCNTARRWWILYVCFSNAKTTYKHKFLTRKSIYLQVER